MADGGDGICVAIFAGGPLEVPPGESVRSVVSVDKPGRYRIRVRASDGPGSGRFREAVSNTFTVEYSPMG
ncbi:MAG: ACBP60 family protein [Gemmatimonadetes bacterium]|nr:ACBP60 family protein [Gemmatimonadota bacterium]